MGQEFPHRREFTRVTLGLDVRLRSKEDVSVSGPARDLSMAGVYVHCDCPLEVGTECEIEIQLAAQLEGPRVEALAEVVRVELEGVALEFTAVPLDALEHLRNLLLYNAKDPTTIEQELSSHIGLRQRG